MTIEVLIVDDDPMVANLHQRAIENTGDFRVVGVARNGWEAVVLAEELQPALVILDVYMPHLDGMEVLQKLRAMRFPADVIMITAARNADYVQEAMRQGAFDYIVKPFRLERLTDSLRSYTARASSFAENRKLSQKDIDTLLNLDSGSKSTRPINELLPKGLNEITLVKVSQRLAEFDCPVTADEVALVCGVSRVTARRYLEFMVSNRQARVDLSYGTGRPSRLYAATRYA